MAIRKKKTATTKSKKRPQKSSTDYEDRNPSETYDTPWLYAERKKGQYPESNENGGKWLIYVYDKNVDIVWKMIKEATENGHLGGESKVSTALPSPLAPKPNLKVICVYTYDYTDEQDVMRVREQLREIGVTNKIPYKTDKSTRAGNYTVAGKTRISTYFI